jgi:hypothetical protein
MNGARFQRRSLGGGLVTAGLALVIAVLPVVTGCESDADADSNRLLAPDTGAAFQGMSPPTVAELTAGAGLSEEQGRSLEPALTRWREEAGGRDPRRDGRRFGSGPGGSGVQEPPLHAFLQECAAALDTDRFVAVVTYLAERRETHREERQEVRAERRAAQQVFRHDRRGRRGDGPGFRGDGPGAGMREFLADLELTAAQRAALHEAMRTANRALREMHGAYAGGDLTADGVKSRAQEAVDALRASLQEGLTGEQFQAVVTRTRERARDMAGRRLEHLDAVGERHTTFLTGILALDDGQVAGMEQARTEARSRTQTLLNGIQNGGVAFADAVYEGIVIHEDLDASIRAGLTEDQIRRLDALERLRRGGGPRFFGIYL